jgi:hypothetical protein
MKDEYDFSKCRKNPYAAKIKAEGYSITVHYSPEDVAAGYPDDTKDIVQALVEAMTDEDVKQLLLHIRDNYDIPCHPALWEGVEIGTH